MEIAGDDLLEVTVFCFTFPYGNDTPSQLCQYLIISPVSFNIFLQFGNPVFNITRWNRCSFTTRMLMPEATSDLNNKHVFFENDIRFSWQFFVTDSKAESIAMQKRTHHQLWRSVFASYSLHVPAALFFTDGVHQSDLRESHRLEQLECFIVVTGQPRCIVWGPARNIYGESLTCPC